MMNNVRISEMSYLDVNKRIAGLIGWTDIFEIGGSLMGKPPGGSPQSRDQGLVPDWSGDWKVCGELMVKHSCFPVEVRTGVFSAQLRSTKPSLTEVRVGDFKNKDEAIRRAICLAAINSMIEETYISKPKELAA